MESQNLLAVSFFSASAFHICQGSGRSMETSMVKFPLDADIGEVTTVRFITAKGSVFFFSGN